MSSILDPLVVDSTQRPVCRIVRQFESNSVVYALFEDAEHKVPKDISEWRVRVVDVERLTCRIVDGAEGAGIEGPFLPFEIPDGPDGPAYAAAADFGAGLLPPEAPTHSYHVTYPPTLWPWPIAAPNPLARRPVDPLVVVRVEIRKPGGVVQRVPLLLAVRTSRLGAL